MAITKRENKDKETLIFIYIFRNGLLLPHIPVRYYQGKDRFWPHWSFLLSFAFVEQALATQRLLSPSICKGLSSHG